MQPPNGCEKLFATPRLAVALLAACVTLSVASVPRAAHADETGAFVAQRARLVESASESLLEYTHELHEMKLFRDRNEAAERLLTYFPDDKQLRSWLKYKRDRESGGWVRRRNYKAPRNYAPELESEVPALRTRLLGAKLDAIWDALQESRGVIDPSEHQRTLDMLIHLDPTVARFREANREVLVAGSTWVLAETSRALERRQSLTEFATEAHAATPDPVDTEITDRDIELGVTWSGGAETPLVRVITCAGYAETVEVARACHATVGFFKDTFDLRTGGHSRYTVCLLSFEGQKRQIVERMNVPERRKRFLMRMSGFHVPPRYLVHSEEASTENRKDSAVRRHMNIQLTSHFGNGLSEPPGLHQGLGLYLTYRLIGTRLTVFVEQRDSRYSHEELEDIDAPSLEDSDSDWVYIGHKWDEAGHLPPLSSALAVQLNKLTTEDLLVLYCFARYLVDGRPDDVNDFLSTVGGNSSTDVSSIEKASLTKLGAPLVDVDRRLRRWLREMAERTDR